MTRKDYNQLAGFLRDCKPLGHGQMLIYWHALVINLSDRLKDDNPRFDAVKFLKACELGNPDPRGPMPLEMRDDILRRDIVNYHKNAASGETEDGE